MHPKTAFRLLQVILLSSFFTASYAQDSARIKSRAPGIVKTNTAQINPATPQQKVLSGQIAVSTDKSINGQYQFILSKLYHYQQPMITSFYRTVQDSLRVQRTNLAAVQSKLSAQTKKLAALQTDVDSKEQSLSQTNEQINSISFLGMQVAKTTYNTIMWGLVIALGALAAAVIFLSGSARREAHYRTKLYNELEEEYKGYKTKANEKEKKMSRDLQTVRNKLEEITGNPEY
jgi:Skp family chaperone for outer membrane proteins